MAEHSPSPKPKRAIYGFVLYLAAHLAFFSYVIWAWLPEEWLHKVGFTYYPSRHWAVTAPLGLFLLYILAYPVYIGISILKTSPLSSIDTITDDKALDVKSVKLMPGQIPPIADLCISDVNRHLYLEKEESS